MAQDKEDYEAVIADLRYQFLTPLCAENKYKNRIKVKKKNGQNLTGLTKCLTHKIFGMLIMIVALFFCISFYFQWRPTIF
jgi:Fe2+ transport system protein B